MSAKVSTPEPMTASESERETLRRIEELLQDQPKATSLLINASGETVDVPETLQRLLLQAVQHLAQDEAVSVVPVERELTTQRAADLLNVSRPFLIQLLQRGEIPHTRVGTHRRIRFVDLIEYKRQRDEDRRAGLRRITRLSQKMGLYDTRKTQ